jgi:hypothetical protein
VTTYVPADPERVLDNIASVSWIAGLPEPERTDVLARMRTVVEDGETPQQFPLHVDVGLTYRRR